MMAQRDRGSSGSLGARLIPWLFFTVGIGTTAVLYGSISDGSERRNNLEFQREVSRIDGAIQGAVRRQVSVLQATAGAVAANPDMTQSEFSAFYRHLTLGEDARNLEGVGLSLSRPWNRRGELNEQASRRGVRRFDFRPAAPRPEADAVVLFQPLGPRTEDAPGFDMHTEPVRREAMDRARKTGRASMSSVVYLRPDDPAKIPSFLFYLPVQDSEGLVFSSIHADRLFRDLFTNQPDGVGGHIGVRIWTGDAQASSPFYRSDFDGKVAYRQTTNLHLPEVTRVLKVEVVASPDFGFSGVVRPYVRPVGIVVSVLLLFLTMSLVKSREESERREAEQALLADVGRLTTATSEFGDAELREIAHSTARTFDAVCRIDLYDEDGTLRTISTRAAGHSALDQLEREYPRAQCDPLFRRALETGRPQRAAGYEGVDERHRTLIAALESGPVLIVPFRLGERALGAITLVRGQKQPGFSAEAAALGEGIAGRLALALDNARFYHELERRVAERTRDLEASNRELESFCYSVSHDLRTPLRSLDGFGRVLKEDYGERLDDEGRDHLDRILAAAKRMDELITALLTLSRLTRREIVPTDVDVTSMVEDQMHDLDPDGKIRVQIEPNLKVRADSRMVAVLFDNLLGNAVKFSSRTEAPAIAVGRADDGSLFVKDNGAGFDMAYAGKLFQPFERLHSPREFPGHGIGLATVERIVRRHGGEVRAEGRPGEGATFFVRFPD